MTRFLLVVANRAIEKTAADIEAHVSLGTGAALLASAVFEILKYRHTHALLAQATAATLSNTPVTVALSLAAWPSPVSRDDFSCGTFFLHAKDLAHLQLLISLASQGSP